MKGNRRYLSLICLLLLFVFSGCTSTDEELVPSAQPASPSASTPAPQQENTFVSIASSYMTYYAVREDGTLVGWGDNYRGLINNPEVGLTYDGAVEMMKNVSTVYAGEWVTLALCRDGTLWGIGSTIFGLLPEGDVESDQYAPRFLMDNVLMAAPSGESACALRADGTVWQWGDGEAFQPKQILTDIVKIAATSSAFYAIDTEGALYAWGTLLPMETDLEEPWLEPRKLLEGVTDVAASGGRLLVQKADNSLWRMGWWQKESYAYTDLELWMEDVISFTIDLAITEEHTLWSLEDDTPVPLMDNVASAVRGEQGILVLDRQGRLWMLPPDADVPTLLAGCSVEETATHTVGAGALLVAEVPVSALTECYAIREDRTLLRVERDGSDTALLENVAAVYAGQWANYAIDRSGTLWGMGGDTVSRLPGAYYGEAPAEFVPILEGVASLAQYSEAWAMVKQDGTLWAWGDLLGAASWKEPVYLADQVLSAPCEAYPGGLYIKQDHTLWRWEPVLQGDGSCVIQQRQVLEGVLDICRWDDAFFVLKEDGTAWLYEELEPDGGVRLLDGVRSIGRDFLLQEDGTLWEALAEGKDCTLRKIGEQVSYAVRMYAWDTFLCLDQDGVLWTLAADGSRERLTEGIRSPS